MKNIMRYRRVVFVTAILLIGLPGIFITSPAKASGLKNVMITTLLTLADGESAYIDLILPAAEQVGAEILFVGEDGQVLAQQGITSPLDSSTGGSTGRFFATRFTGSRDGDTLSLMDDSNSIFYRNRSERGIIAVLIGLVLPDDAQEPNPSMRSYAANVQVVDIEGNTTGRFPFVTQFMDYADDAI